MKPLTPASPHAILMIGIPGAGKSVFAEKFADTFQAPILNRTKIQKDYELDDEQAEALGETILVEFMKSHRTLLIEGGLELKDKRDVLVKRLNKAGYRTLFVWVQTDTNEAHHRATKDYPKGSGLTSDEFDEAVSIFEAPHAKEKSVVISGKHTYATQLKIVLKQLATNSGLAAAKKPEPPAPSRGNRSVMVR